MKNSKLKICDSQVYPGERANLALPLPELYSCAPMYMPIRVFHGKESGATLVVLSTTQGFELNGIEIINRLTADSRIDNLKGTLITIPVLNVFALSHYPKTSPSGRDLTSCFPGDESGSYGQRIAYTLTHEILKKADGCIELQTGELNHEILPQIYCDLKAQRSRHLARHFQAPVVTDVEVKPNSLRETLDSLHIPFLVYEAGEALRFNETAISVGVQGILNTMKALEMIDDATSPHEPIKPVFSQNDDWLLSPKSGIFHTDISLGEMITTGQNIGSISDPLSPDFAEKIKCPFDGIVVGINNHPLIYEGQRIVKVAAFLDNDKAELTIEEWEEAQPDEE
ncbi:MAG: succinylglutamate desuccinylase/aspartoacylase family protein [Francisellaceae bacterium]